LRPTDRPIQRDFVLHPGVVAILPLVDTEHVCLLCNHRAIINEVLGEVSADPRCQWAKLRMPSTLLSRYLTSVVSNSAILVQKIPRFLELPPDWGERGV
jgi:hypothetical protein